MCSHTNAALVDSKYGIKRYQEHRNAWHQNAHDNFLIELAKWGLSGQDLVPNVNFFSKVVADVDGTLRFEKSHARKGCSRRF